MKKLAFVGAFLALALLAAPASAQVQMAWKFQPGDTFTAQTEMAMKQTVTVLGMNQNMDTKMTIAVDYTVKSASGSEVTLEQVFSSVKVDESPVAAMMQEVLDKLKGQKLTFTLNTEKKEVTKIEGAKEMIKKLTEDNPQAAQMMGSMMNEDALKQQMSGLFTFLPSKPVTKGESWEHKSTVPLGPLGGFKAENKYTYKGTTEKDGKKLEKIVALGKMTYYTPKEKDPKENNELPFEIVKADLKADDIRMTYYFDAAAGRLHSSDTKNKFKGSMTVSAQGMEISLELEQEQNATVKVEPKKAAK